MTPEAAKIMAKAADLLTRGRAMVAAGLGEDAGRSAYLAAFNAARALIWERTGRLVQTHRGVRSEFHRVMRGIILADANLLVFLSRAYAFKTRADYDTEPSPGITLDQAAAALAEAERFIAAIAALLDSPAPDGA
ncbi:HEPN domain-containing protein [Paracraurococcus lichenis]|uniref:HEPN domain-containing protein n=1 Tax=Paracraurococcus lichenis TaxID=3064888 RepID=A0ABT9DUL6_9PROT|nr:HEPN domain-containing protein [Paracraurococcus sp. LOR1-02]MDO9707592.1 HEPN domain-containing protein [Paracraurococcus sp. LOR1-02]